MIEELMKEEIERAVMIEKRENREDEMRMQRRKIRRKRKVDKGIEKPVTGDPRKYNR